MANVNCYGSTVSNRGGVVPLLNTATTEATQDEIRTDSNFVGSVQVFGTFATQQHGTYVLAKAGLQAENDFTWAYVQSAGKIKAALPIGGGAGTSGGNCGLPAPIPYPKTIASGDSIQVMVNSGTDREAAVSVACTNGEYHVFSVTPGGAGELLPQGPGQWPDSTYCSGAHPWRRHSPSVVAACSTWIGSR